MRATLTARCSLPAPLSRSPPARRRPSGSPSATRTGRRPYPTKTGCLEFVAVPGGRQLTLDRALLTARDLGRGFAQTQYDPPAAVAVHAERAAGRRPGRADVEKGAAVFVDDVGGAQVSEQIVRVRRGRRRTAPRDRSSRQGCAARSGYRGATRSRSPDRSTCLAVAAGTPTRRRCGACTTGAVRRRTGGTAHPRGGGPVRGRRPRRSTRSQLPTSQQGRRRTRRARSSTPRATS